MSKNQPQNGAYQQYYNKIIAMSNHPHILQFWYTAILSRRVKSTPKRAQTCICFEITYNIMTKLILYSPILEEAPFIWHDESQF